MREWEQKNRYATHYRLDTNTLNDVFHNQLIVCYFDMNSNSHEYETDEILYCTIFCCVYRFKN